MKKLRLPIIRGIIPKTKSLSMDDYLKFVTFNLKYTIDKKAAKQRKRLSAVNTPFSFLR